ncbi:MAG: YrhB domain-containing protein [Streptosporangiales bacterium]
MDLEAAISVANRAVDDTARDEAREIALDQRTVIERGWCYVFFWDSKDYLETGDWKKSMFGNSPIVVPKDGSEAFFSGTHAVVEELLDEYEQSHGIAHGDQRELTRHGGRSGGVGSQQRLSARRSHDDQRRLDHPDGRGHGSARPR